MINKNDFTNSHNVQDFINFMYEKIKKTKNEEFPIVRYYDIKRKCNVQINTFEEALTKYFWAKKGIQETEQELNKLSENIQNELKDGDNIEFLSACYDILEWGGVLHGNIKWLVKRKTTLMNDISDAIDVFLSDEPDLSEFGKKYRSNAGLTKIYALLKPENIIIYDSRVAAALGKFIVDYFGLNNIPNELNICLMSAKKGSNSEYKKTRNPKNKFPKCNNNQKKHAESNIKSNWILTAVNKKLNQEKTHWNLRKIEAALFMIGYDLYDQNKSVEECSIYKNKPKEKKIKNSIDTDGSNQIERGEKSEKIRAIIFSNYILNNYLLISSTDVLNKYVDKSIGDLTAVSRVMRSKTFLKQYHLEIIEESGPKSMLGNINVTYKMK